MKIFDENDTSPSSLRLAGKSDTSVLRTEWTGNLFSCPCTRNSCPKKGGHRHLHWTRHPNPSDSHHHKGLAPDLCLVRVRDGHMSPRLRQVQVEPWPPPPEVELISHG